METIFAASFVDGLNADERDALARAASRSYPKALVEKHHTIKIEAEQVSVGEPETFFRLEAEDSTELLLVRPEGVNTCQLAPYKSWEMLFERFRRDLMLVWETWPDKQVNRLAVRSINRIDVPLDGPVAHYEEYLALHIKIPKEVPSIGPFSLELMLEIPDAKAAATIRSSVTEPPVEGIASFILDIDVARVIDIPSDHADLFDVFNTLREPKNTLYRTLLTPEALKEFG